MWCWLSFRIVAIFFLPFLFLEKTFILMFFLLKQASQKKQKQLMSWWYLLQRKIKLPGKSFQLGLVHGSLERERCAWGVDLICYWSCYGAFFHYPLERKNNGKSTIPPACCREHRRVHKFRRFQPQLRLGSIFFSRLVEADLIPRDIL